MGPNSSKIPKLFLLVLTAVCIYLGVNRNDRHFGNYHGVMWGDASGYYAYLPMWFIYGNNAENYPEGIIDAIGNGFQPDSVSGKVKNKYPSGVAILQAPFFLVAHLGSSIFAPESDGTPLMSPGFSRGYYWSVIVSGAVYAALGLFLLCSFLCFYFEPLVAVATCLALFLGTNLYYYAIICSGMSHVYSFFVFSALLYYSKFFFENIKLRSAILFGLLCGLAVLIRPTNILFIAFVLLLDWEGKGLFSRPLAILKKPLILLAIVTSAVITWVPQMIYWYQNTGQLIYYSYGDEGFTNWKNPEITKIWFSTMNGLFPYAPVLLLSVIGIVIMAIKKVKVGLTIGFFFLLITYVFASWWVWSYGCALGSRPFVEYFAMMSIPLAFMLNTLDKKWMRIIIGIFVLACIWVNIDINYDYEGCFYGGEWDLQAYLKLLEN